MKKKFQELLTENERRTEELEQAFVDKLDKQAKTFRADIESLWNRIRTLLESRALDKEDSVGSSFDDLLNIDSMNGNSKKRRIEE